MIRALKAEWLFSKGQRQAVKGNWEGGIKLYNKALSLAPKYSGIYLHKALCLSKQKRYEEAIIELKKAIALKPNNPVYYLFLGIIFYDIEKYDNALENFEKSLKISDDNDLVVCFRCLTNLAKEENINDSLTILKGKIQNTNIEFRSRFMVLCELFLLKNKNVAMSLEETIFYNSYLKQESKKSFLNNAILRSIQYGLSYLNYSFAYKFKPDEKKAYLHCISGDKELYLGNIDKATIEFQKALNSYPYCDVAIDRFFDLCIYKKDFQSIMKRLKELPEYKEIRDFIHEESSTVSKNDKNKKRMATYSALFFNFGVLYYHTGEYKKAAECFSVLISDEINNSFALYYLGLCHIAKKNTEEAFDCFQKSMGKNSTQIIKMRLEEMIRVREKLQDKIDWQAMDQSKL